MNQDSFRAFYGHTAIPLRAYLARATGDPSTAEDLMQECYLRILKANLPETMDDVHRRHYLFRIGTNLVRDRFRSMRRESEMPKNDPAIPDTAKGFALRELVDSAFVHLRSQDRQLLWLAYAEEMSHKEIAAITGYRAASVRPLLSQAKRRLATVVRSMLGTENNAKSIL
jgi:RNA polymerase sigma-70 factor (ECF subfamily)